jgi:hypothetical protein
MERRDRIITKDQRDVILVFLGHALGFWCSGAAARALVVAIFDHQDFAIGVADSVLTDVASTCFGWHNAQGCIARDITDVQAILC